METIFCDCPSLNYPQVRLLQTETVLNFVKVNNTTDITEHAIKLTFLVFLYTFNKYLSRESRISSLDVWRPTNITTQ